MIITKSWMQEEIEQRDAQIALLTKQRDELLAVAKNARFFVQLSHLSHVDLARVCLDQIDTAISSAERGK